MADKLISIVMPTFNGSRTIAETIESVLKQTYTNFEFIIVNDCSTDNNLKVISRFQDERIHVYSYAQNEHICYALNYGLKQAHGDYIARIDDDDCWEPEKLEKQLAFMEENPEYGACFTLVNVMNEKGVILKEGEEREASVFRTRNRMQRDWVRYFFFNGSCLCHPSVMIRREVLDKVGVYNYALVQLQDFELWTRIAKQYPIYVMPEKLVRYRWATGAGSVSSPTDAVRQRSNFEFRYVLSKYLDNISDEEFLKTFRQDLRKPDASTPEEIAIERAFLLIKVKDNPALANYSRQEGLYRLIDLLNDDACRQVLRDEYHFTQKDFYKLAGETVNNA